MIAFKTGSIPPAEGAMEIPNRGPSTALNGKELSTPRDLERLGDEIARLAAHLHAATYQLLVMVREFDERAGWSGGFRSCGHWLSWRTGIGIGPAREKVRVARALSSLPEISAAMARGELSFSKVRALTRVATPENEGDLLGIARHATAAHIEKLVRAWRRVDRTQEANEEQRRHQRRSLHLFPDEDGSYVLHGRLEPEVGALLEKALEWAVEALYQGKEERAATPQGEGEPEHAEREPQPTASIPSADKHTDDSGPACSLAQKRADALGLVAERALAEASDSEGANGASIANKAICGGADRYQVVIHVDANALSDHPSCQAALADSGCPVSAETFRRLACDSGLVMMAHDSDGRILDVGRKRRTVPPAIRRALEFRDKGCRFPGCGCRYTDAHHVVHWSDGGETKLENLVLLCRRHHRAVHEEGWRIETTEDGTHLRFRGPDGSELLPVPQAPSLSDHPTKTLVEMNRSRGITPDSWTATPDWHGEPLDLGLAIDTLWEPRTDRAGIT
jgi:hypothetical protein